MGKIKFSYYFVGALGVAILLNILAGFQIDVPVFLQKNLGFSKILSLGITAGPLIEALLWSAGIALIVSFFTAFVSGAFEETTTANWSKKKSAGISNGIDAFFIAATAMMLVNLTGTKHFNEIKIVTLGIALTIIFIYFFLPPALLYLQRLGDAHNEGISKKIDAKKAPGGKKKTPDVDKTPSMGFFKWTLIVLGVILVIRIAGCGNANTTPPIDPIDYGSKHANEIGQGVPQPNH